MSVEASLEVTSLTGELEKHKTSQSGYPFIRLRHQATSPRIQSWVCHQTMTFGLCV